MRSRNVSTGPPLDLEVTVGRESGWRRGPGTIGLNEGQWFVKDTRSVAPLGRELCERRVEGVLWTPS